MATLLLSDSENSSEDEFYNILQLYNQSIRRPRVFRDRSNPMTLYDDQEFRMRLRLDKNSVLDLLNRIEHQLSYDRNISGALPSIQQLLLTLRFYASGSFQVCIICTHFILIP